MNWSDTGRAVSRARLRLTARAGLPVAALLVIAVAAGCSSPHATEAAGGAARPAASAPAPKASTSAPSLPPLPASPAPLPVSTTSPPVRVDLPTLGVSSSLEDLGLAADGSLASPSAYPVAGWYAGGVRPGDDGPAIIAGHVDSYKGPAVFYRLGALKAGDPVTVTRADGTVVQFTVESQQQYPKSNFPTDSVYGPTPTPELRLITCTGIFDRKARSYESNLVVTAVLANSGS